MYKTYQLVQYYREYTCFGSKQLFNRDDPFSTRPLLWLRIFGLGGIVSKQSLTERVLKRLGPFGLSATQTDLIRPGESTIT